MNSEISVHDVVASLEDVRTKHFESDRPLLLRRGQIGTVVMTYQDGAREVEFADRDGRAFAILPLRTIMRWRIPMADCPLITFGLRHASTTKTLAKSSNPSSSD